MRRFLSLCLVAVLGMSTLTGCASKYGTQQTKVNYYPACYRPIQDLRDRENSANRQTAGGGLIGALGGALLGLMISGGKWQGAAVGATAGGAAGLMAGNAMARRQQQTDDNIRLAGYLDSLDGDISNLDIVSAAAKTSLQCYDGQFKRLLAEIKAKSIGRDAAAVRFAEISSGREEAISILGDAAQKVSSLNEQYERAFLQEEEQLLSNPQQQGAATQKKSQTIKAARQRAKVLTQKTDALRVERAQAQDDTMRQAQEINEALANTRV